MPLSEGALMPINNLRFPTQDTLNRTRFSFVFHSFFVRGWQLNLTHFSLAVLENAKLPTRDVLNVGWKSCHNNEQQATTEPRPWGSDRAIRAPHWTGVLGGRCIGVACYGGDQRSKIKGLNAIGTNRLLVDSLTVAVRWWRVRVQHHAGFLIPFTENVQSAILLFISSRIVRKCRVRSWLPMLRMLLESANRISNIPRSWRCKKPM